MSAISAPLVGCAVAPLEPLGSSKFADRLNPKVEIDGRTYALITQKLVTIRKSALGPVKGSIAEERDAVIAPLDLLFTGF